MMPIGYQPHTHHGPITAPLGTAVRARDGRAVYGKRLVAPIGAKA